MGARYDVTDKPPPVASSGPCLDLLARSTGCPVARMKITVVPIIPDDIGISRRISGQDAKTRKGLYLFGTGPFDNLIQ
jgi:hypothetical protein